LALIGIFTTKVLDILKINMNVIAKLLNIELKKINVAINIMANLFAINSYLIALIVKITKVIKQLTILDIIFKNYVNS
jgi:hypothetical protein